MRKISILFSQDHTKHQMIMRKIHTFTSKGYQVNVIDFAKQNVNTDNFGYAHNRLKYWHLNFFVKNIWRIIRRIPSKNLHDTFWLYTTYIRFLVNAVRSAAIVRFHQADILIADDIQSLWAAIIASKLPKKKIIFDAHELESEQGDNNKTYKTLIRNLERKLIPQVDRLVVPNTSRANVFIERVRLKFPPTVILNTPPMQTPFKSDHLREVLGLNKSSKIVLYHGALIPFRCLNMLIKSVDHFNEGITLVLIGEQGQYYKDVLEPTYNSIRFKDRVFFIPYVPHTEIPTYIASADLGIVIYQNSNLNNFLCAPTKLYEFVMMKTPVAVCNFPELVQFIEEYPVGVTFDPEDPRSISNAINAFFSKPESEFAEIMQVLEKARLDLNWENESQKWLTTVEL